MMTVTPFRAKPNVTFLHSMKTSENQRFSDIFWNIELELEHSAKMG